MIQGLSDNIGNTKPKSLYQILLDSGYSESSAKQQVQALNTEGVQRELKPIVQQLEELRQKAIDELHNNAIKIQKTNAKDLSDIIDKLTKNIQLLGGKPTDTIVHKVEGFNMIKPHDPNDKTTTETMAGMGETARQDN